MTKCPTCGQRIDPPAPLRITRENDHKVGRAVRAVVNELVGRPNTPETRQAGEKLLQERLGQLGYTPEVAQQRARWGIEAVLG